jgi:hypothetical protein
MDSEPRCRWRRRREEDGIFRGKFDVLREMNGPKQAGSTMVDLDHFFRPINGQHKNSH